MLASENSDGREKEIVSLKKTAADFCDPGILLIAVGLAGAFILVVLSLMFPAETAAETAAGRSALNPATVREGGLLFENSSTGEHVAAPLVKTEVKIEITGLIAFARVSQEFINPGPDRLEGIYVFPLPEESAVNHLVMDVGTRVIEAVVQERAEARTTYGAARQEGRTASLLEQARPNIFMMSVANIGPHERVIVELAFQQAVRLDHGVFSLRFPVIVGPRYAAEKDPGQSDSLLRAPVISMEAGAPGFSPPGVGPGPEPDSRVSLEVALDPGFSLASVQSLYHSIDIERITAEKARLRLTDGWTAPDRDFVLEWRPAAGTAPQAALYAEEKNGEHFIYLMVVPPAAPRDAAPRMEREVVFVVDVSGSMAGPSIRQAREALAYGVARLRPGDRFNIMTFNDRVDLLFPAPRPGDEHHIRQALNFIDGLEAGGGTEIEPALMQALAGNADQDRLQQLIFLTDGCVNNEQGLFKRVSELLGKTRIFTVGIGSAPNSYLMRNLAEQGKGAFTYIGRVEEVRVRMQELFLKLEDPLLTEIRLSGGVTGSEMFPDPIPDLYAGEPLTVAARMEGVEDRFVLSGYLAGKYWQREIIARTSGESEGISLLWARRKIKALMVELGGGADPETIRTAVLETALKHQLVSRYTSFVAVDVTPTGSSHEPMTPGLVRAGLPHGWQYGGVVGLARTGTVGELCLVLGGLALLLSAVIRLLLIREKAKVCGNGKS